MIPSSSSKHYSICLGWLYKLYFSAWLDLKPCSFLYNCNTLIPSVLSLFNCMSLSIYPSTILNMYVVTLQCFVVWGGGGLFLCMFADHLKWHFLVLPSIGDIYWFSLMNWFLIPSFLVNPFIYLDIWISATRILYHFFIAWRSTLYNKASLSIL